jgi:AraC family transcriptional regulator of adaptative response/methylated-DNA-[protein]-cysteine methyltransferase
MRRAFMERDASYDGLFFVGVTTTGIFCVASCSARRPNAGNVRFFRSRQEALTAGFRACQRCRPMNVAGEPPPLIRRLVAELESTPRIKEAELRQRGLDPGRVRRSFVRYYGMTFQAFQRAHRLGRAFAGLRGGTPQTRAAFASGYDSLSGFREAYHRMFGTTPGNGEPVTIGRMHQFETPIGGMVTICCDDGVRLLEFLERRGLETELQHLGKRVGCTILSGENDVTWQVERELREYFEGTRREFTVPLQPAGTPFQRSVWDVLRGIPYGTTRSYADQARAVGQPSAVRAVARANGDNPIAIVIPCHRVIGADGKLTGYGGGLWRKQYLLDLESAQRSLVVSAGR